jgi:hypothetical protein
MEMIDKTGQKELENQLGTKVSEAYVKSLLKRQNVPITDETIELKTQSILIGRFRKKVKAIIKDKE